MKKLVILPVILFMMINSIESKAQKVYDFVSVDKVPQYPGGMKKFYEYLEQHIKYPQIGKTNKTSGRVFLSFIVEKSGKLTAIQVIRSLSKETDAEAVRVLKESPNWDAGIIKGQPVRVKYNINIKFDANGVAPVTKSSLGGNKSKSPQFPGGEVKLYSYLSKTLKYPKQAQKNHIQGKVLLSFYVEKNGSLTNIEVIKGLSKETDAEALKVIKNSPNWIPAIDASGKPARTKFNLPVNFTLS